MGVPVTHWSAGLLAVHLQSLELDFSISESSVRRILQDADLQPHRQKTWLTSQDEEFRAKRDDVLHVYYDTPPEEHIICVDEICDNLFAHDTDDVQDWFDDNPRWKRHFTPKHASWLNQVECMFGIIQRRVLRRGSFTCADELIAGMHDYMIWHNQSSQPFRWSYRPKSWSASRSATDGGPS